MKRSRFASSTHADRSGGKLPPVPMSLALAEALDIEAALNYRSPRDQALAILSWYFGLMSHHPNEFGEEMQQPVAASERSPDICPIDINLALTEIERLSGGEPHE